jgi:hypothetical protein
MTLHKPQAYRYEVAEDVQRRVLPRFRLNRYGWQVIGATMIVRRFAYCLLWGRL